MRKITKKNTEDLVSSINNMYGKIQDHLDQFKIKRDQVELISQVDIESLSSEFKKVLGLLELQVKEYQLKRLTDEFVHEQTSLP
jgi:cystathionine beta-lyase family protein involved in aluminum resistance